jgi:hypothetical protein
MPEDANATCETDSNTKKLAGAARTSHMKKCVTDAVGEPERVPTAGLGP